MKRFFVEGDGRFKTGRVAFLVFLSVIAGCSLLFYMGKPADQVIVAVKHVFDPKEAPAPAPEPKPETEPVPDMETLPEPVPKPEPETALQEEPAESPKMQEPADTPVPAPHAAPGPQAPDQVLAGQPESAPDPAPEQKSAKTADKPTDNSTDNTMGNTMDTVPAETVPKAEAPPARTGSAQDSQPVRFAQFPGVQPEKAARDEGATGEVALSTSDYLAAHNSWRQSGVQASGEANMPLRIENLKAVYPLFQMKAVGLRGEQPYVDLSDGTRIAEGALAHYATTCFQVADPFGQWGRELEKAGLSPAARVEVRYYMYDTIRNAIYARAAAAFECTLQKGLIPEGVTPDAVDLLGRAYAIRHQGGGGFGVFVPVSIDLPDGRAIAVDPSCFSGSADIDHLMASGQLR